MAIAGLILAAGGSRRMGKPKQLLPWGDSKLLEHSIRTAQAAGISNLFIVLGAYSDAIQRRIDLEGLTLIRNPDWFQGMGTSIAAGIRELGNDPEIRGCLILLPDQPFISSEYLKSMIDAFDEKIIVASKYGDHPGAPCLFPRIYFPDLEQLKGDEGARKVLRKHPAKIKYPAVIPDLRDIDTPEKYKKYIGREGKF